ncbi:MAG: IS3 family transposase [Oscillospiraceae bacterium]
MRHRMRRISSRFWRLTGFRGYAKGVRGIHMRLLHTGVRMNGKKIRRLMKKFGLVCPIRKANPYRRMQKAIRTNNTAENLVKREFEMHGPRSVLLTDITYIPLDGGSATSPRSWTDARSRSFPMC